jgi:hypothetical protein
MSAIEMDMEMKIEHRRRGLIAVFAALVVFAFVCCASAQAGSRDDSPPTGQAQAGATEIELPSARRIAQDQRLRELISRSHRGLTITRGPRGEMSMHLQGRFHSVSTAHIGPDGKLHMHCHDDHDDVQRALQRVGVSASGEAGVQKPSSDGR